MNCKPLNVVAKLRHQGLQFPSVLQASIAPWERVSVLASPPHKKAFQFKIHSAGLFQCDQHTHTHTHTQKKAIIVALFVVLKQIAVVCYGGYDWLLEWPPSL